jgi:hypothetical protein
VSAGTLEIIGTILVAVIGVAGTSIAALISYQTWRQKRQPVIADIAEWREVVSAQKQWLDNIETYIKILTGDSVQSAVRELRKHTWELAFQKEQTRIEAERARAEDIGQNAIARGAEYKTKTNKALGNISPGNISPAMQKAIDEQAGEIEQQEKYKAIALSEKALTDEKQNENLHKELPKGALTDMFTQESAPALLQLRQGREATEACRKFNEAIEIVRKRVDEPPQHRIMSFFIRDNLTSRLVRRRSDSYLRSAISSLSKAQAKLTEISYLQPELLLTIRTDNEESVRQIIKSICPSGAPPGHAQGPRLN